MPRLLTLACSLPVKPARAWAMYLNPKTHAAITGAPVKIGRKPGSAFSAFGGILTGRVLHVESGRQIVQSWRSANWKARELDSTLILTFFPEGKGTRLELAHVNVPASDFAGVTQGWEKYYFAPWRAYLSRA